MLQRIGIAVTLLGVVMSILTAVIPMSTALRWSFGVFAFFLFVFAIIILFWPRIHPNVPSHTTMMSYNDEQLSQGADVFVPPSWAIEIPIEFKKGENTQIQINCVESQKNQDNFIDSMILNKYRKVVSSWNRSSSYGYGICIPVHKSSKPKSHPKITGGHHLLRLSNEQKDFEKQVRIKVSRQPYLGSGIPMIIEVGTIRWS